MGRLERLAYYIKDLDDNQYIPAKFAKELLRFVGYKTAECPYSSDRLMARVVEYDKQKRDSQNISIFKSYKLYYITESQLKSLWEMGYAENISGSKE